MKTLTTTKARMESQLMSTGARLAAVREDEDRLAKRIARVNDDICRLGSDGDPTALKNCSIILDKSEADLAKAVSRSKAIADEECALDDKIDRICKEINELSDAETAAKSEESTLQLEPADEEEVTSTEEYDSVLDHGIDNSADLSRNTVHAHAEPLSHDQTTVGTVLTYLYDDGQRREGTVTKVYAQEGKKGKAHEHATWRKVTLTETGETRSWDMAGKTKDGEFRTRFVRLPDNKTSPAPMALTG